MRNENHRGGLVLARGAELVPCAAEIAEGLGVRALVRGARRAIEDDRDLAGEVRSRVVVPAERRRRDAIADEHERACHARRGAPVRRDDARPLLGVEDGLADGEREGRRVDSRPGARWKRLKVPTPARYRVAERSQPELGETTRNE